MAKISRAEQRKKLSEERKPSSRITRASIAQQKGQQNLQTGAASRPSRSANSKQPPPVYTSVKPKSSMPSNKHEKHSDSNVSATSTKRSKTESPTSFTTFNSTSYYPEQAETTPKTKKAKYQYVDAVEKLETSTSVHVPKRLILFVGNLPEDITKEQLLVHFKRVGGIKSVRIPKQKGTELARGFAYIEFSNTISHRLGVRLHNTTLADRKIIVEFALDAKMTEKKLNEKLQQAEEKDETVLKMPFDT